MHKYNILFIGPFTTESSWGRAARSYLKSILTFTDNVRIEDLYMGGGRIPWPEEIIKYRQNKFKKYDVVIQLCLPHLFCREGRIDKNIGIFFSETDPSYLQAELSKFRLLDAIWVPSLAEIPKLGRCIEYEDALFTKFATIGIPSDLNPPSNCKNVKKDLSPSGKKYIFYTIGEDNERKNLEGILRAYLTAFYKRDNVCLFIKTNKNIDAKIHDIKKTLRCKHIDNYPEVSWTDAKLTEQQIHDIHHSADCYVNMSLGESWCFPAFDACVHGNKIIYPSHTGIADYATSGMVPSGSPDRCFIKNPPLNNYYTGNEAFSYPNIENFIDAMQAKYNHANKHFDALYIDDYSYEKVGKRMIDLLENM